MADQEQGKTHGGEQKPGQGQKPGNEPNKPGQQNQPGQPSHNDPSKKSGSDQGQKKSS